MVKPLGVKWMIGVCDYLKSDLDILKNGFKDVGILQLQLVN